MTIQEALSKGLETTVIGLIIVFTVLLVLMIVLKIMEKIFYKPDSKNEAKVQMPKQEKIEKAPEFVKPITTDVEDEEELIAVLTAAIAASLNTSTYNLKIKSYRRVSGNAPAWKRAGLTDTINSRF